MYGILVIVRMEGICSEYFSFNFIEFSLLGRLAKFDGIRWSVLIFISGILFVKHSFYTLLISYGILSTFWSLIFIWKKEAVGIGDVLISFAISSWLAPLEVLLFLWSSFAIGGVISIGITLIRGKQEKIPFVPFLSLGGIIAYVWGKEIIFWYASIL